jgi:hypothetical protein
VTCSILDCDVYSSSGEYPTMALRVCCKNCVEHTAVGDLKDRIAYAKQNMNYSTVTVIFYYVELNRDGSIEQICAFTDAGKIFNRCIKTNVRTNTSPRLRRIPLLI